MQISLTTLCVQYGGLKHQVSDYRKYHYYQSCRDNVGKCGRDRQATNDNIIRHMRYASWITKATDTHSQYVTLIALLRQQWLRERASVLRYTTLPLLFVLRMWSFIASIGTLY
jgi:hypothetical protein